MVNSAEDRARVREFFAQLEPSERVRLFDFFSHQVGYVDNPGSGLRPSPSGEGGLDPEKMNAAHSA